MEMHGAKEVGHNFLISEFSNINTSSAAQNITASFNVFETPISDQVNTAADEQAKKNLKRAKTVGYVGMATVTTGVALTALYLRNKK